MLKHRIRISAIMALLSVLPAMAQMDNVIDVEHVYKPDIKDANKINIQPEISKTTVNRSPIDYSLASVPVSNYTFTPVWAVNGNKATESAPRRFLTIGGGTEGNLLGRAAVGLEFDKRNSLDIDLGLSGHNAKVENTFFDSEEWESRFYSTSAAAAYTHSFDNQSALLVKAAHESQVFNYQQAPYATTTDKQHNSITTVSAGLTPYRFGNLSVGAGIGYQMFSQNQLTSFGEECEEGLLTVSTDLAYSLGKSGALALGVTFTNASYNDGIDGYSNIALRPHYMWRGENIDIKAGLYIGTLGIAPDLGFTYHIRPTADIYADITGGDVTTSGTFRSFAAANPYWALATADSQDVEMKQQFNQLSARAGLRFAPTTGLRFDINAGYELSADRMEFMPSLVDTQDNFYAATFFADGNRLFINVNASYDYKDRLSISLANQFNAWTIDDNTYEIDDVLWQPVIDLDWSATFRILEGLRLGADFRMQTFKDGDDYGYTRPTTADLGVSLAYTLTSMPLTVYVKGDNLLNQDYDSHIGYRAPGINVMAGAAITF